MSKKKQNKPKRKKNNIIPFKPNRQRKTLRQKLSEVYNSVDLRTTCNGRCQCCKVAMPQMNYCEFVHLLNEVWRDANRERKLEIIYTCIEYFFRHDYDIWGMDTLIKPCLFTTEDGKCSNYEDRPLNCRLYGLWPDDVYKRRVDKFEEAYKGKIKREDIPLNTQCPFVKRLEDGEEITEEVINAMFSKLDDLDLTMRKFTPNQVRNKESYRSFHDWFLWTFFGEDWLSAMTKFVLAASKEVAEDQLKQIKIALNDRFSKDVPQLNLPES